MHWYLCILLACVARVSAGSRPVRQSCHPLVTVSSTTTTTTTLAASTVTVKKTETFYTRVTRYRAGHTITTLVNVTSTLLHTCTPISSSSTGLRRRDDTDSIESSALSTGPMPVVTEAPFLNVTTTLPASLENTEDITLLSTTDAQPTEISQSSSILDVATSTTSHETHSAMTSRPAGRDKSTAATTPATAPQVRPSKHDPKFRSKPSKPTTAYRHATKSLYHDPGWMQSRKSLPGPKSRHINAKLAKSVTASCSPAPTSHEASTKRYHESHKTTEHDVLVEVELLTTQQPRDTKPETSTHSTRTRKTSASYRCEPTFTAVYTVTSTKKRPPVTRTVTYAKLKTSTQRATKTASTKHVTSTSIIATATATVIAGRSARFTDRSGAQASFDVYANVSFPGGDLARCACDGRTPCLARAPAQTCTDLHDCMRLCAAWNGDPMGPACVGVSFARTDARAGQGAVPWCLLKWIVPPHSVPPQGATCGWISEDVDSAVLRRQTF